MRKVRVSVCVALREESSSDFATQKLGRNSMECVLMMWIEKLSTSEFE